MTIPRSEKKVYFLKPVGMDGPIKIGSSFDPMKRLRTLSVWSPFPLELIGAVSGDCSDELFLHRHFADLHSHREWFRSSPLLRGTIEKILGGASFKNACADIAEKGPILLRIGKRNSDLPPDRLLFRDYSQRIRASLRAMRRGGDWRYAPAEITNIIDAWRCDGGPPIIPTPDQIAQLDEYLSDPAKHSVRSLPTGRRTKREQAKLIASHVEAAAPEVGA